MSEPRILRIDLARRTAETVPGGELPRAAAGGAALNEALLAPVGAGGLVLGAGPLAGTLAPAAALLVASFVPAAGAPTVHVPLLGHAGPDLRRSGVDHLLLTGEAPAPTLVHLDGGRVRFVSPPAAADLPALVLSLRRVAPPCRTAILIAAAGQPGTAVSLGLEGSLDKAGLARALAARNLRGILLGGSGGVAIDPGDPVRSLALAQRLRKERPRGGGLAAVVTAAGGGDTLRALRGVRLRPAACFHCPAPCRSHAEFPATGPQGNRETRSVLIADPLGWIALARKRGTAALALLAEALRLGLDPVAAAAVLPDRSETPAADREALAAFARGETAAPASADPSVPRFGGGLPSLAADEGTRRLTALACVLGLCPILLPRFPWLAGALTDLLPAGLSAEAAWQAADDLLAQG